MKANPVLSFIIPAHNEANGLARVIGACRESVGALSHEIIVVDDSSTDETAEVGRMAGAQVISVQHRRISSTRNSGARAARGQLLIFVDADTWPNPEVVNAAIQALEHGAAGGSAAFRFDRPIPLHGRFLEWFFVKLCRFAKLAAGCFVFCTRESFRNSGGFPEDYYAAEEWVFSRRLKRQGPFVVLSQPVETSGRKLRAYTLWELTSGLTRMALSGFRSRQEIWYQRKDEPPWTR